MTRVFRLVLLAVVLLSACGSPENPAPKLSAPPTRTPIAAEVATRAPAANQIEVISLRGKVADFLATADTVPALEQTITFMEMVSGAGCLGSMQESDLQFQALFAVAGIRWPIADFTAWRQAVEAFPEAELIQQVTAQLQKVKDALPLAAPLRVCLIPVPEPPAPGESGQIGRSFMYVVALNDLNTLALAGDLMLVTCSAGGGCLDDVPVELTRGYSYTYQQHQTGMRLETMTLLDRMVFEGRANDFTLRLFPEAAFPWTDALTSEDEAKAWRRLRRALDSDEYRYDFMYDLLYGYYGDPNYPVWGGVYVGDQIVQAYRAQNPELSWTQLAAIPPEQLFTESGYDPSAAAYTP